MLYTIGIIICVLAICISILLHELGHLAVARLFKCKVIEYFAGFGPKLYSFTHKGTEYGLKAILVGGYVKILGSTSTEEISKEDEQYALYKKHPLIKICVIVAGAVVHFILAYIMLFTIFLFVPLSQPDNKPIIGEISKCVNSLSSDVNDGNSDCANSQLTPAFNADLRKGDRIIDINNKPVNTWNDVVNEIIHSDNKSTLSMHINRDGETLVKNIPVVQLNGQNKIGIQQNKIYRKLTIQQNFVQTGYFYQYIVNGIFGTFTMLLNPVIHIFNKLIGKSETNHDVIISHSNSDNSKSSSGNSGHLTSIFGIMDISGNLITSKQYSSFFLMIAQLNISLGIFNLLPLLPLDGGHIAVAIYEWIRNLFRKKDQDYIYVNYEKLSGLIITVIGIMIIMFLVVSFNDIKHMVGF